MKKTSQIFAVVVILGLLVILGVQTQNSNPEASAASSNKQAISEVKFSSEQGPSDSNLPDGKPQVCVQEAELLQNTIYSLKWVQYTPRQKKADGVIHLTKLTDIYLVFGKLKASYIKTGKLLQNVAVYDGTAQKTYDMYAGYVGEEYIELYLTSTDPQKLIMFSGQTLTKISCKSE